MLANIPEQSSTQQGLETTRTEEVPPNGKHMALAFHSWSVSPNHGSGSLLPDLVRDHMMAQLACTENHFM